jgi:prepilin-type N-terminal cleavage/methylation domain-containing protein
MPLPATRISTTAARRTTVRHGFSLVELLVVLGIIAAMAGLVLGGLFRSRDGNRLLAAEQVLADAIRQARHTARSTGAPVELRLTPVLNNNEVVGARLAGVSRTTLWSETFDKVRDVNDDGVIDADDEAYYASVTDGSDGVVIGRSGNGRLVSAQHPIPTQTLPRGGGIVRGGRTDGFFLACSVKPQPIAGLNLTEIPLVIVGGDGSLETSQCGIGLIATQSTIQNSTPPIQVTYWDLTGWVYDDGGRMVALNQSLDPVPSRHAREAWDDPKTKIEVANPISGGRWVDVGLLYDGRRMVLYLDGQRVAERRTGVPDRLRSDGADIHVGTRVLPGSPATVEYAAAPLDDIRLARLSTAEMSDLPGNVVLVPSAGAGPSRTLGWRMLCQPDGRVEVSRDDQDPTPVNDQQKPDESETQPDGSTRLKPRTGNVATILLGQLHAPGTIQNAEVTVTLDGHVESRLIAQTAAGGATP